MNPELVVNFVVEFLAAHVANSCGEFARDHTEGHAGEERQASGLVLPVVCRPVHHLGLTVDDGIKGL